MATSARQRFYTTSSDAITAEWPIRVVDALWGTDRFGGKGDFEGWGGSC